MNEFCDFFSVQRYEITDVSIIFYVSEIDTEEPLRLAFDMRQTAFVNQPQPARIYVYDYYEPLVSYVQQFCFLVQVKLVLIQKSSETIGSQLLY